MYTVNCCTYNVNVVNVIWREINFDLIWCDLIVHNQTHYLLKSVTQSSQWQINQEIMMNYGSPLRPYRFHVTAPPLAKTKGRENERKVQENDLTKCREDEISKLTREKTRSQVRQRNATRKRGNEKTKLRNLNPLSGHSIYFVIAYISFYLLAVKFASKLFRMALPIFWSAQRICQVFQNILFIAHLN